VGATPSKSGPPGVRPRTVLEARAIRAARRSTSESMSESMSESNCGRCPEQMFD
jgi:hypothetical protein